MSIKFLIAIVLLNTLLHSKVVLADIYKCQNDSGEVVFDANSSVYQGCKLVLRDVAPSVPISKEKKKLTPHPTKNKLEQIDNQLYFAILGHEAHCDSELTCNKLFKLTQIYVSENATMKLQTVTNTIIETYSPINARGIGIKAIRKPSKGNKETFSLVVYCKPAYNGDEVCKKIETKIYNQYRPYIESAL